MACSVGIGLGAAVVPGVFKEMPDTVKLLAENGIVLGSFTAILLNWFLHFLKRKEEQPRSAEVTL